jgi:cation transport protein ChaC
MAWELVAGQEDLALKTLWAREMRNGAYRAKLLKVKLPSGECLNALGFVARREHPNFLRLREDELLRRLAQCRGDRGSNQDYLANTVHALQQHGISDQKLQQLLEEVQAQRSN